MGKKLTYSKKKNHCWSKRKYKTEITAMKIAKLMTVRYHEIFNSYPCKYCKQYHIGRDHRTKSRPHK